MWKGISYFLFLKLKLCFLFLKSITRKQLFKKFFFKKKIENCFWKLNKQALRCVTFFLLSKAEPSEPYLFIFDLHSRNPTLLFSSSPLFSPTTTHLLPLLTAGDNTTSAAATQQQRQPPNSSSTRLSSSVTATADSISPASAGSRWAIFLHVIWVFLPAVFVVWVRLLFIEFLPTVFVIVYWIFVAIAFEMKCWTI